MKLTIKSILIAAVATMTAISCQRGPIENPPKGELTMTPGSASVNFVKQTVTFTVESNVGWTLVLPKEDAPWITSEVERGNAGSVEVALELEQNSTGSSRMGEVIVAAPSMGVNYVFVVTQSFNDDPDAGFAISVVSEASGSASANFENALPGVEVEITATPSYGYSFAGWVIPDHGAPVELVDPASATTTFVMPSSNVNLVATFDRMIPDAYTDHSSKFTGINLETYQAMREVYYWSDAVKRMKVAPSNNMQTPAFLEALIENLDWLEVQDVSHGEWPATIDGQWNAQRTEREHIYSFVQASGYTRGAMDTRAVGTMATLGMGVTFMTDEFTTDIRYADQVRYFFVSWTLPGGPAEKAGLKRGAMIEKLNGSIIGSNAYSTMWGLLYGNMSGTVTLTDTEGKTYTVSSQTMDVSPVIGHEMITSPGGKQVAYMVYSEFAGGRRGKYDDQMREAFGEFLEAGAEELVLDLRYNGGGVVNSCQVLSSLVADVTEDDIFCQMLYNPAFAEARGMDNPEVWSFLDEENALDLRRVYVLTTKNSASASEMVISALKGENVEVIIVGDETNGKNVGMNGFYLGGMAYEFRPITFKIMNGEGFCDYAGGFQPTFRIDELRGMDPVTGAGIKPLGDPAEELLNAALTHIDGGTPVTDPLTRSLGRSNGDFVGKLTRPGEGLVIGHTFEKRDGQWVVVE
ncbi:MAG: hypothetical protein LBV18_06540 [Alistipes sp.]|jgi:hypothetical protein|nr:hypothetical protein [Alistipes sp.]